MSLDNERTPTPLDVLMIDDNPADINLVSEALAQCAAQAHLQAVTDGQTAMQLLRKDDRLSLKLVLLDLNIPRANGHAVLREIKSDPALRSVPVVIFSTSGAPRDICASYQSGANSYVVKPGGLKDFFSTIATLSNFWLECAILPSRSVHE